MNILVVGNGGREHALIWKLKQSTKVKQIFAAPGNAGTSELATNLPLSNTKEIINWVRKNQVNLVVVGNDSYLAEGIVDKIEALDIPVFGPTKTASEIEWSKSFAKQFMKEEGIPTADFETFVDIKKAKIHVKTQKFPLVIKANGLALGKGVIIANNITEAENAVEDILSKKVFGKAGNRVVIEEYLYGREISVHAFCDGERAALFPSAEDHKRIGEGDIGPNTGGMGTIAPVPWVTEAQMKEIKDKIVLPTLKALKKRDRAFKGVLFPGIMITETGPKVIEFNARFGDPETQSYMRILKTDLIDIIFACIQGNLGRQKIQWHQKSACCIVVASEGYPGRYKTNRIIHGLESISDKDIVVFHAGAKNKSDKIVTNGGRVLGVSAIGDTLPKSLAKAYATLSKISFTGMQFRKDIGMKSIFFTKNVNVYKIAVKIRKNLQNKKIPSTILARLYQKYNTEVNVVEFVKEAKKLFPKLNCGLASVYLKYVLGRGEVVSGKYDQNNHTFLKIGKNKILDITADQYGGPEVYFGEIKSPWSL